MVALARGGGTRMWLPLTSRTRLSLGRAEAAAQHLGDPGAGGVDDHPRRDTCGRRDSSAVQASPSRRAESELGAGGDLGAALGGVERVEHDEAGIVDPGVPIGGEPEARLQRRVRALVRGARERGSSPRPREQIVEQEAEPEQPEGPPAGRIGQHEFERADDVRARCAAGSRARAAIRGPGRTRYCSR